MKVDTRLTLALLLAIFVQAAGGLIWAGQAATRLDVAERRIEDAAGVSERLARVEEKLEQTRQVVTRIERKIDREPPQ